MMVFPKIESIKEKRISAGISQHQLNMRADLSWGSICRIENGSTKRVNMYRAKAIADVLHCPVEDIFTIPSRTGQTLASNT